MGLSRIRTGNQRKRARMTELDTKHQYKDKLRCIQLAHRIGQRLCIYCGVQKTDKGACDACRQAKSRERMEKYGFDYLEEEQG